MNANLSSFWIRNSFESMNSRSDGTDKQKREFLPNILTMKKHQVKLKQPWIAEIGLSELSYQFTKESGVDKPYSDYGSMNNVLFIPTCQKGVFRRSRGRELKKF